MANLNMLMLRLQQEQQIQDLAEVVLVIAFFEYAGLATAPGARVPRGLVVVGVAAVAAGVPYDVTEVVLVASALVVSVLSLTTARRDGQALLDIGSSLFPLLYLGLPIGALLAVQFTAGREAVVLLLAVIMLSDTAQYYGGRTFGRTPLAPVHYARQAVRS